MKRLGMTAIGLLIGLASCVAVLALFVHRPPECGEPAACGDDYLFPALPIAVTLMLVPAVYSFFLGRRGCVSWMYFIRRIGIFLGLVVSGIVVAYFYNPPA